MDEKKKKAYRSLLYYVLIEIRAVCWDFGLAKDAALSPEPMKSIEYLTDWFHNLALFSACDFEGFDEDMFWEGRPGVNVEHYRKLFEEKLK